MRRLSFLLAILIGTSCVASMRMPTLAKPATPTHSPAGTPIATWPLSGGSDTETVTSTVAFQQGQGNIYYVATNGDDSNPGTEAHPFRTIAHGASILGSGDTLYIRAGTYHEQVVVSASGTADQPITVSAYPGEQPVIDAQDTLPDQYRSLVRLDGDHITLAGLEIKNVYGTAVSVRGDYNTVCNMRIHHVYDMAIFVGVGGDYCSGGPTNTGNIVEDNEVWMASLMHEGVSEGGPWTGAINVGRCPQDTIVRRNIVHENWGIGIHVYEAYNTTIEDNVAWNNQLEHYYLNCAPHTLMQRNLAYSTPDSIYLYRGYPGVAFAFCDERSSPVSRDITIINNLALGTSRGFYFFNQQSGSGLKDFLIANNTFVSSIVAGLQIDSGDHESCRVYNNIISLEDSVPPAILPTDPELHFSHNLWSTTPPASASGPGDVIGDPLLAESGPVGPGLLDPGWFRLLSDSPAIDAGIALSEVPDDFGGVSRPRGTGYDIGAYESLFSARVTDLRVVAAIVDTPTLTITLRWTAPVAAVTYTLRSSDTLLTAANWSHASIVTVPFTASEPGSSEWLTTPVDYTGGTLYLALKSQNSAGIWSELSNNAFWPHMDVYLPLVMKDYV